MITPEHLEELDRAWNESSCLNYDEYREWYENLTAEEQAQIDAWDKQYNEGVLRLCSEILAREKEQG